MEKRMSRTWLFLMLMAVIAAVVVLWLWAGKTAGSYSGGILVELTEKVPRMIAAAEALL